MKRAAIAIALPISSASRAQAQYDVTDLGAVDATSNGAANAMNEHIPQRCRGPHVVSLTGEG